ARLQRSVTHGEDVIGTIDEEYLRHRGLRQQRVEDLHNFLFAINPVEVTEPGVARAELGTRLLEDEGALRRFDAKNEVRNAPAEGRDANGSTTDPARGSKVVFRVVGG